MLNAMTINLTLTLNDEQAAALSKRALASDPPLTEQAYLMRSLNAEIASYVEADFQSAAQRLIEAAKTLPFEERAALIAEVEQKIQAIA
jgi:hypothetical protein